jgi:hypothetical protein
MKSDMVSLKSIAYLGFSLTIALVFLFNIHDFLAINKPTNGDILIVEGWISNSAFNEAKRKFEEGNYSILMTVGGPIGYKNDNNYNNYAERAADIMIRLGIDKNKVRRIEHKENSDNTANSALSSKRWLQNSNLNIAKIDVFTLGVHARQSYVTYRKVFKGFVGIGVISGKEMQYNTDFWLFSQKGIYLVSKGFIGYLYAMLFI